MEDNGLDPANVLDMIASDASPAEITDSLKTLLYAKSGERLEALKPYAAASVFGGEAPEEPTAELETEVDQEPAEEEDA